MKRWHKIAVASAIGVSAIASVYVSSIQHVGPSNLYPNSNVSPGLIATTNLSDLTQVSSCGTYSQCHRNTSDTQKNQVRSEYPSCPPAPNSEIDHIIPLALGGADDVKNLWCQPAVNQWNGRDYGFHTKDALETYLAEQVKARNITPTDAQQCILQDWVKCYNKYLGQAYGSSLTTTDPDATP